MFLNSKLILSLSLFLEHFWYNFKENIHTPKIIYYELINNTYYDDVHDVYFSVLILYVV